MTSLGLRLLAVAMVVALVATGAACVPTATGKQTSAGKPAPASPPQRDEIAWNTSFATALAAAQAAHKPLVVDFYATWCGPCKLLAERSFPTARVQALRDRAIWARVDVDQDQKSAEQYKVSALPTVAVMDENGKLIDQTIGFMEGGELGGFLERALAKAGSR